MAGKTSDESTAADDQPDTGLAGSAFCVLSDDVRRPRVRTLPSMVGAPCRCDVDVAQRRPRNDGRWRGIVAFGIGRRADRDRDDARYRRFVAHSKLCALAESKRG